MPIFGHFRWDAVNLPLDWERMKERLQHCANTGRAVYSGKSSWIRRDL